MSAQSPSGMIVTVTRYAASLQVTARNQISSCTSGYNPYISFYYTPPGGSETFLERRSDTLSATKTITGLTPGTAYSVRAYGRWQLSRHRR